MESVGGQDLENAIARLGIAEYQENKLRRFLAGRVDESNPVALSKGSSTYTFERGGREYRITIDVETYDTKDKSITRSQKCNTITCIYYYIESVFSNHLPASFCFSLLEFPNTRRFIGRRAGDSGQRVFFGTRSLRHTFE